MKRILLNILIGLWYIAPIFFLLFSYPFNLNVNYLLACIFWVSFFTAPHRKLRKIKIGVITMGTIYGLLLWIITNPSNVVIGYFLFPYVFILIITFPFILIGCFIGALTQMQHGGY